MAPPSKLDIAKASVFRLTKEEESYHKELERQHERVLELEKSNGDFYEIRQEKQGIQETYKMFPTLHDKLKAAVWKLEQQLEQDKDNLTEDEIEDIKSVMASAWVVIRRTSGAI
ncbi:Tubulin-specific chaperone A-like protein [Elsinoe fawcettii]|nr:Tubulin-specific chaperone A-like protein [Elsinoe fawcettii]